MPKTMERDKWSVFYRHTIEPTAKRIADSLIADARNGDGPVVFVTGNSYFPAGRSFADAEAIYQSHMNEYGEAYESLWQEIQCSLQYANVLLDAPEHDNCLYVVDMNRWEYTEDSAGDDLSDEWKEITP
jgi:hypothetical protein